MLVVFGGFIAAGIPLIGAGVSIAGALGALLGFTFLLDIDTTVVNVVTAVGLGLSIDYGLLIVSRFREEYRAAGDPAAARARLAAIRAHRRDRRAAPSSSRASRSRSRRSGCSSSSRAIVKAIGLGALAVTVISIASALTLIPALLSLTGDRLLRPGRPDPPPRRRPGRLRGSATSRPTTGFFSKLTRRVQRHPAHRHDRVRAAARAARQPARVAAARRTRASTRSRRRRRSTPSSRRSPSSSRTPRARGSRWSPRPRRTPRRWADAVADIDGVESAGTPVEAGDAWRTVVRVDPADGIDVVNAIRADRADAAGRRPRRRPG